MRTNKKNNIASFLKYYNANNSTLNEKQKKMLNDVYPLFGASRQNRTYEMLLTDLENYFKKFSKFPYGNEFRYLSGFVRNHMNDEKIKKLLKEYNITIPVVKYKNESMTYSEVLNIVVQNRGIQSTYIGNKAKYYILKNKCLNKIKSDVYNLLSSSDASLDILICYVIKNNCIPIPSDTNDTMMKVHNLYSNLSIKERFNVQSFIDDKKESAAVAEAVYNFIKENNRIPRHSDGLININFRSLKQRYPKIYQSILDENSEAVSNTELLKQQESRLNKTLNFLNNHKRIPEFSGEERTIRQYLVQFRNKRDKEYEILKELLKQYNLDFRIRTVTNGTIIMEEY